MTRPAPNPTIAHTVRELAERVRQIEGAGRGAKREAEALISSGSAALDRLLPQGGLRRGTLVEWLAAGAGCGAATLALLAAREASREAGAMVVMDRRQWFYPPAAASLGIDLAKLIVVRAASEEDEAWALDQALRSSGVAAVLAWPEELDDHTFRRLQLAAETSGALGLLVRDESVRPQPSWAELRLAVEPLPQSSHLAPRDEPSTYDVSNPRRTASQTLVPVVASEMDFNVRSAWKPPWCEAHLAERDGHFTRRLRVELLRCRGGLAGGSIEVELAEEEGAHEENSLRMAPPLAASASRRRATGT